MIAIDTNVLARLLLRDDEAQYLAAKRLFDQQAAETGSIWVSDVVLAELVWVLSRMAGQDRAAITRALTVLSKHATVQLESPAVVRAAIALYAAGPADFADCLLAVQARDAGAEKLHTFDRKMRSLPGVSLL
jgi:predicted nucleic-acid-binding protein